LVNEKEELEKLEKLEAELNKLDSYGSPEPEKKENIFKFFREILTQKDTTRIGNLNSAELGITRLGARHYLESALYAEAEGLDTVAAYLRNKSGIITSTSMSRKGFWPKLFVTQIKKEQKIVPKEEKKGWFSKKTPNEDMEE